MLEILLQIDKESNSKKSFFFFFCFFLEGGGGGGGGCGWEGVNIMYKCFKGTSTLQRIQMCQIVLKYVLKYRRNSPDKLKL